MTHYSRISPEDFEGYARSEFWFPIPIDLIQYQAYFRPGDTILEVGCGWGRLWNHIVQTHKYVGLDIHEPYLEYFRETLLRGRINANIVNMSILDYSERTFDVILFPWTVIGDLSENDQRRALERCHDLLATYWTILLDNPAKETPYSESPWYAPTKFYYEDWTNEFPKLGFGFHERIQYETLTKKVREITVLKKNAI